MKAADYKSQSFVILKFVCDNESYEVTNDGKNNSRPSTAASFSAIESGISDYGTNRYVNKSVICVLFMQITLPRILKDSNYKELSQQRSILEQFPRRTWRPDNKYIKPWHANKF